MINGKTPLDDIVDRLTLEIMEKSAQRPPQSKGFLGIVPLDPFGDAALIGSPPCPPGLLPGDIETWADDVAYRMGVDFPMVAMPMLCACAAAIDDRVRVAPLEHSPSWQESCRLWVAFVADSGEKKTPALKTALAPLYALEKEWAREDQQRTAEYAEQHGIYLAAKKLQDRMRAKALAAGKEVALPDLPEDLPRPPTRRRIVQDTTIEALGQILIDNQAGLLEVHDELSGWFGSFDAYRAKGSSSKDRALYLEAYNGGPQLIDRISRGRLYVPNWSLCIVGGIQPEPMKRCAGTLTDDGLIQRFMVVFTHRGSPTVDQPENETARIAYERLLARLTSWDIGGPEAIVLCRLSTEAHTWREFINLRVQQVRTMPWVSPAFHAHLAKWEGLFPRLLLLWHIIESSGDLYNLDRIISGETAARVTTFMLEYLLPHAARFYTELLQPSVSGSHAQWIAGHILAHTLTEVSCRTIGRAYREIRGETREIQHAMEHLIALGWAMPAHTTPAGVTRWTINPDVHVRFAARARSEQQRRAAIIERIRESVEQFPALQSETDQNVPNVS